MPLTNREHFRQLEPLIVNATDAQLRGIYCALLGAWLDRRPDGQSFAARLRNIHRLTARLGARVVARLEGRG